MYNEIIKQIYGGLNLKSEKYYIFNIQVFSNPVRKIFFFKTPNYQSVAIEEILTEWYFGYKIFKLG
jgi:hypothetical protein